MAKVTTVGEMIKALAKWPDETTLFINALDMDEYPGEYEWHFGLVDEPTESELEGFRKGYESYLAIRLDTNVEGC